VSSRFLLTLAIIGLTAGGASPLAARPSDQAAHVYPGSGDYYVNSDGRLVHRPVRSQQAPAGAAARCRDGTWSFSLRHRGTCSSHGGVAAWL